MNDRAQFCCPAIDIHGFPRVVRQLYGAGRHHTGALKDVCVLPTGDLEKPKGVSGGVQHYYLLISNHTSKHLLIM